MEKEYLILTHVFMYMGKRLTDYAVFVTSVKTEKQRVEGTLSTVSDK